MSRTRVVAVNDDPIQLHQIAGILGKAGYEVSPFTDAAQALESLEQDPGVDLFVVDLHMPGIDGWKMCRLLRSPDFVPYNDTPILLVSATFAGDDVAAITEELGANSFLEAPFKSNVLLEFVAGLLAGESPKAEPELLIVEDDEAVRRTLARAFGAHGYRVLEAEGLAEALPILRDDPKDLVLLDYHLPEGNCEELLDVVREEPHRTCVLVMTGDPHPDLPVRLLARGADGYLRKPFDPEFAVELARKARRERSLLRVETVLESRTRELVVSEERYRSLFETIPDLVAVVDPGGEVLEMNPDGLRSLGLEEAAVVGRSLVELCEPRRADELAAWLRKAGLDPRRHFEVGLTRRDGSTIALELRGRAIQLGTRSALLLVGRDLTERRAAEEERRKLEDQVARAQRLESLGVLAGGVAHDFNNLLVEILGNASLAEADLPEGSPAQEALRQIEGAAERAADLTQQILAFAGKSHVVSQQVQLSELVAHTGSLLKPAVSARARVSYHLEPSVPLVMGDASQIRQIVMTLIMNASDALGDEGGTIQVATFPREVSAEHPFEAVEGERPTPGSYVALQVTDDGSGMDAAVRDRMFEPFFTTKFMGRGLGLAAGLGIVRSHDGYLSVDSEPGRGTTMTVLLPVAAT